MEKKKLDWIVSIIREQMVANAPGASGGFSGSADPKGPVAGFDPLLGKKKKDGTVDFRRIKPNYRRWVKDK
jgi:hypothetical protein